MSPRRRRGPVVAIVALAVVVLLAAGLFFGDRAARDYAEQQITSELRTRYAAEEPTVRIDGWPFLTQAAGGRFDQVTVDASAITLAADAAPVDDLHATLTGVTRGSDGAITAEQMAGSAALPYADLTAQTQAPVSFDGRDDQGRGRILIDATVPVLGLNVSGQVSGRPELTDATITLAEPKVVVNGVELPDAVAKQLVQQVQVPVPSAQLPTGLTLTEVAATETGVTAQFTGTGVILTR